MESKLIEYFRFEDQDTGILSPGRQYILATQKDFLARQVSTSSRQIELLKTFSKYLRYDSVINYNVKWNAIKDLSKKIQEFFIDISGFSNCQLDTVLNAAELGMLPFELLLDNNDIPYFANASKKITFTRRIRQNNFEIPFSTPITPRVLFVYSHGGLREVPYEEHLYELDRALNLWGGQGNAEVFKMIPEASFKEFADELTNKDSSYPYTHIHILSHGKLVQDPFVPLDFEYEILFGKGKDVKSTPAKEIKSLFESLKHKPFLVNYMICDAANFTNSFEPDKNPVQVTHKAGVPIVLGSQFPLSMPGSTIITKLLYSRLFIGEDIRCILNDIRVALFQSGQSYHDWISLVAYLRLPEGYSDYLYKISLHLQMQKLKQISKRMGEYLLKKEITDDEATEIISDFTFCIKTLNEKLNEKSGDKKNEEEVLENMGMLGSAYKRLAEIYFLKSQIRETTEKEKEELKNALNLALDYYKNASQRNLSHHWSTVQYLSLDTVLNGNIKDMNYCASARIAINNALSSDSDAFAYGSLLELQLISKETTDKEIVLESLSKLIEVSNERNEIFPIESTRQQISRYVNWWTEENGFHIDASVLVRDKDFMNEILNILNNAKVNFNHAG